MTPSVILVDDHGQRSLGDVEWPVSIGGAGCDLTVRGPADGVVAAHLGVADDAVFIQPATDSTTEIHCNGVPLTASRWIDDGDRLTIGSTKLDLRLNDGRVEIVLVHEAVVPPASPRATPPVRRPLRQQVTVAPTPFTPRVGGGDVKRRRLRPGPVLLWSSLALMAVAAWFILAGTPIEIVVQPNPDRLELRGRWPVIPIDGRFFVLSGSYRVEAELADHRPLSEDLEITRGSPTEFRFTLEPLPGRVRITTAGITGAEIHVNGELAATSPAQIELPRGEHAIVVRAQRHAEATRRLSITEPGQELTLDIVLEAAWAPVSFRSAPTGAAVTVDGHHLGVTPLTAEIGAGRHSIELRLAGHTPYRAPITVVAEEPLDIPTVRLDRASAVAMVVSEPPGASVTVDDEFEGVTPVEIALSPDVEHEITLAKGGYALHTEKVTVAAGESARLSVELEALTGRVIFSSRPPGAELVIDGEPRGRTETTLELAERTHTVEIRHEGYLSYKTVITPRAGVTDRVDAVLESVEAATRLSPTLTSPQGVELTLIEGGRFTAGASRRVPGRRANETLREIEITRPFYLAVTEVTNRQYREFVKEHQSGRAGPANLEIDHHPVVRVSWNDAARYCNWLSEKESLPTVYAEKGGAMIPRSPLPAGYRLPTEAEWVWAARYDAEGHGRKYSWGDDLPIPPKAGNFGDQTADGILGNSLPDYNDGYAATAPAGSFTANQRGLHNMGGNVSEWVQDLYTIHMPRGSTVIADPMGPTEGEYHVIRGASWTDDNVTELRLSYRDYGDQPRPDVGFRIARSAP